MLFGLAFSFYNSEYQYTHPDHPGMYLRSAKINIF